MTAPATGSSSSSSASDAQATPPALTLGTIGQIALTVRDVPRAVRFYRDTLGVRQLDIPAPPSMAFFDCGGVRLMLSLPEQADVQPGTTVLYFTVPDIHAAAKTLTERGISLAGGPHLVARMSDHELWMAFFTDPDGNPIAFMCEMR